jgi:glycosyltransferase involved in cell wall biosynthesis
MNICIVTSTFASDPEDSSHAAFLLDLIRLLERYGHKVSVLTQAREPNPTPALPGLDVVWFPWLKLGNRLAELSFGSAKGLLSAASLIVQGMREVGQMRRSRNVDVFFCAWFVPSGFYVFLDQVLGRSRTPYVLWALGSDVNKYRTNPVFRGILRGLSSRAGALYADGFQLARDVGSIAGRRCEFFPTFRVLPTATKAPRGEHRTGPRFLYVGRHAAVKGIDVLVEALVELKKLGNPAYRFDIVGDGDLTPALVRRVTEAGLLDRIHFRGLLSNEELAAAYEETDCVVIPSRSESIPLVLSEALQHGRPLIVTDVGDMGDLSRLHGLGLVVPPENPPALAEALRRFISTPSVLDPSRVAKLLDELTLESAVPKLLDRLETLVSQAANRP